MRCYLEKEESMKNFGQSKTELKIYNVKDFFKFVYASHKCKFAFSVVLVIFRSTILLTPALITKYIVDQVLNEKNLPMLMILTCCLVLVPVFSGSAILLDLKIERYVLKQIGKIRVNIYNNLQKGELEEITKFNKGDILYRITDQMNEIADYFYFGFTSNVWYIVMVGLGIYLMAKIDRKITLAIIIFLIFQIVLTSILKRYQNNEVQKYDQTQAVVNNTILDSLNMVQYIKMVGTENIEAKRLKKLLKESANSSVRLLCFNIVIQVIDTIFYIATLFLIYYFGGKLVIADKITVGDLVAFSTIYTWTKPPILLLNYAYVLFGKILINIKRILEITFGNFKAYQGNQTIENVNEIQIDNICANYQDKEILNNITFNIRKGEKIAIVGKSGAGKSTLANVLSKLKDPTQGKVKINGINIYDISNQSFREKVMYITQDIEMHKGTIRENIIYDRENVSEREIEEAVRIAELEKLIKRLPRGLETILGEGGSKLSGGERQRISIARAVLKRPEVLIMDEMTSALDNLTEKTILEKIFQGFKNNIFIIFTHRLELCSLCDKVIVLDEGKINAIGTHEELHLENKIYKELYLSQY